MYFLDSDNRVSPAAAEALSAAGLPVNSDALLARRPSAAALTAVGCDTSPATLATRASRGGGPPYRIYGRRPLYRLGDLLEWAEGRLSALLTSTSEAAPR